MSFKKRIYNEANETAFLEVIRNLWLFIALALFAGVMFFMYIKKEMLSPDFNFISSVANIFAAKYKSNYNFYIVIIRFFSFLIIMTGLISLMYIIPWARRRIELKAPENIKYIEIANNEVYFHHFDKTFDYIVSTDEINKMELLIHTKSYSSPDINRCYIDYVGINFELQNNKTVSLSNVPAFPMGFIYETLDFAKNNIKNCTYDVFGEGNNQFVRENIICFLNSDFKKGISSEDKTFLKHMSMASILVPFIAIAFFCLIDANYKPSNDFTPFTITLLYLIFSIFDVILLVEYIRGRKYRWALESDYRTYVDKEANMEKSFLTKKFEDPIKKMSVISIMIIKFSVWAICMFILIK